ncbi:acylphosphatase-2-like [Arapaima gigas]
MSALGSLRTCFLFGVILCAMSGDGVQGGAKLCSVDFEIFGDVQVVVMFCSAVLLQYTEDKGKKLGVSGWVKNTRQGTVTGQVQGPTDKVREMKVWLSKVGSPSSRIDRAVFSNERDIPKLEIKGFGTRY